MDYDAIATYFLTPQRADIREPDVPTSSARVLRDALEPIATIGWWSREAAGGSTSLGHGFFDGYVWGRAASLGADVSPAVVVSSFGVFSAALLTPVYTHARTISSQEAILGARARGASDGLRAAVTDIDESTVGRLADRLLGPLLDIEAGPRMLFGGLQSLPVPDDAYGRLWRAAELYREHRGDGHLAACGVAGLDMAEMNVLTEVWLGYSVGEYSATRGFSTDQLAAAASRLRDRGLFNNDNAMTPAGTAERNRVEEVTDASQKRLLDAIGPSLDELVTGARDVGAAILRHHAAPADPRKRAAG